MENFSLGLTDLFSLSITFFIKRFLRFLISFTKNAFFNVFYSWGHRFFTSMSSTGVAPPKISIERVEGKEETLPTHATETHLSNRTYLAADIDPKWFHHQLLMCYHWQPLGFCCDPSDEEEWFQMVKLDR